jgi:hypothetical protein
MTEEADSPDHGLDEPQAGKRAVADRSTIAFPYVPLEDAIAVARTIFESGISLSRDQIGALLGADPSSGGFRLKLSAARTFKLIDIADGRYELSDIGIRILSTDETEARIARRDAFLAVPLYLKAFEAFKGRVLPPRPAGVESAFVNFGVAPKQKDKARLAFEKSALSAGFFHAGKDRLVEPIIGTPNTVSILKTNHHTPADPAQAPQHEESPPRQSEVANDPSEEKLIRGMLDRLPPLGEPWSIGDRARWLRRLAHNLAMVYAPDEDSDIEVRVAEGNER